MTPILVTNNQFQIFNFYAYGLTVDIHAEPKNRTKTQIQAIWRKSPEIFQF